MSALVSDMMGPVYASEAIGGLFSIGHPGSIIGVAAGGCLPCRCVLRGLDVCRSGYQAATGTM